MSGLGCRTILYFLGCKIGIFFLKDVLNMFVDKSLNFSTCLEVKSFIDVSK